MSISDLFDRVASDVTSANPVYTDMRDRWQYLLESYVGGEAYRDGQHLTRYQLETASEYGARLRSAHLDNHCASVVSVYNSFLFRQPAYRDLGSLANSPQVDQFLRDADHDGTSFNNVMKQVSTWSSVFGHCWMIVVKPDVGALTLADEIAAGARPYVNVLTPLNVLDWSYSRNSIGAYTLNYFKYIEEYTGNIQVIKEWTNEMVVTTWIDMDADAIVDMMEEPNGLGKIPAVIAYNKRTSVRGIGMGDINDIADAQRFIYNMQNELEQTIRLDSHPSLVVTPEVIAGNGAGSLIQIPESMDPGLKPYLLEYNGASASSIMEAIAKTVESIDKMANIGSIRATEARRMSGVAQQQEFELLNARLSEKADNLELAEEQLWRLFAEYTNSVWDGVIEYPDTFNIRDTQNDLDFYLKTLSANIESNTFKTEVKAAIADLAFDNPELTDRVKAELASAPTGNYDMFEPHTMTDPATGETRLVGSLQEHEELVAAGWLED